MRHEKSAYFNILAELQNSDTEHYRKYLRMNHETFQVILMTFISSFLPCLLRFKRDMSQGSETYDMSLVLKVTS